VALTADLIAGGSQAADPVISPDGRWVVWTISRAGERERPVSVLWLAPVGGSAVPTRLTDGSVPARLPRWSPDSTWLFYVADEELRRLRITADGPAGGAEFLSLIFSAARRRHLPEESNDTVIDRAGATGAVGVAVLVMPPVSPQIWPVLGYAGLGPGRVAGQLL